MTQYIIGAIFIIAFFVCFIIINVQARKYSEEERKNKGNTALIVGIICLIIGVLCIYGGTSSSDDDDTTPYKYRTCENKSDTYHKCSWSISEDRCVCKER